MYTVMYARYSGPQGIAVQLDRHSQEQIVMNRLRIMPIHADPVLKLYSTGPYIVNFRHRFAGQSYPQALLEFQTKEMS